MAVSCIADTPTVQLVDTSGTLTANLLALGFEEDDGGSNIITNSFSTSATAPSTSGLVTSATAELKITNVTAYTVALLALQFASITSADVPASEIWTLIMQGQINGGGYSDLTQQIFDNSYDAVSAHTLCGGPMIVPFSTVLAPGLSVTLDIRLYLVRSGSGSGSISAGLVSIQQFMAVPCL